MKKIFVSILALAISFGSFAQTDKKEKREDRKEVKEKKHDFEEKRNLTDAQKAQMKSINENFKSQMQALKQDKSLSQDAQKQKREALVKEHRSQVQSLLTPDQKKQWHENKKQYSSKGMKGRRHSDNSDMKAGKGEKRFNNSDRFEKMSKDLNLTSDQSTRIKALNDNFKTNMQSIHNNNSLTTEQQKDQMQSLKKQHKEAIDAILTADQKAIMKNSMKNRKQKHV